MSIEPTPCLLCPFLNVTVEKRPPEMVGSTVRLATEYLMKCQRCGEYRVSEQLDGYRTSRPASSDICPQPAANHSMPDLNFSRQGQLRRAGGPAPLGIGISKGLKVLRFVATRCGQPGVVTSIDFALAYPVADCVDESEFRQYVEYLSYDRKLLKGYASGRIDEITGYSPTIEGWQAVEPTLPVEGEPDRCFVAMWFADELDSDGVQRRLS